MREAQLSSSQSLGVRPAFDSILLGLLAIIILQIFRWEFQHSILFLLVETLAFLSIPILLFGFLFQSNRKGGQGLSSSGVWAQLGAIACSVLPFLTQSVSRAFGIGDSIEVVIFLAVQNAAWFLTVFSWHKGFRHAAFVLFSALVLMICYSSERWSIYSMAVVYFFIAMWWLMGDYWSRVEVKALDGESKTMPVRTSVVVASSLLLFGVGSMAWFIGPITETVSSSGFMPVSGGDSWSDAYARSGIGDGDMLTAGDDATTTGAVDSDQFIEDNKPSIYDMMSDSIEDPKIKKRKDLNRAIAIDTIAKHLHNVKQSEQSGKTFRTVRKPKSKKKDREYEDRLSQSLFYVEGSVPVRFAVDTYSSFDGWDWRKDEFDWSEHPALRPRIKIQKQGEKDWYVLGTQDRQFLRQYRCHKMKMMRLDTKTMPSPSFLKSWHIYRIGALNLFDWGDDGLVDIDGQCIPTQTVIDMVSHVPNYYELRYSENLILKEHSHPVWAVVDAWLSISSSGSVGKYNTKKKIDSSIFVTLEDNSTKPKLMELANEWTRDIPEGFQQVEAIVSRIREDFVINGRNVAPDDCEDSVGYFLETGSGPSYIFATAAAQILRAAGYETRLAKGYSVGPEDYNSSTNQSIVTGKNFHFWPEVRLEGWHWIPVEPTPGHPQPFGTQTVWQAVMMWWYWLLSWAAKNPLTTLATLTTLGMLLLFRCEVASVVLSVVWGIVSMVTPSRKLWATRRLIDLRFWMAGRPRPAFETLGSWYSQVGPGIGKEFVNCWNRANFSANSETNSQLNIDAVCWQLLSDLSFKNIKSYVKQSRSTTKKPQLYVSGKHN